MEVKRLQTAFMNKAISCQIYNFYTNRIRDIQNEIQGRKHNIVSRVIKDFDQQKKKMCI